MRNIRTALFGATLAGIFLCGGGLPAARFIRGDVDASSLLDLTDPIRILSHLFLGEGVALDCDDAADADDTGELDLSDAIYLLNHLFLGGPTPPPPFPNCGLDRTADLLECLGFGPCDSAQCGGFIGLPCGDGETCELPGGLCDGADLPGVCVPLPESCEKIFLPVCGCDGVTYPNDCERLRAGVQLNHDGECEVVVLCGGIGGLPCPEGEFCEYPAGSCDVPDLDGKCIPIPGGCPDVYEPVCGCDGITYSNDCERMTAGARKDHDGECALVRACGGLQGLTCDEIAEYCELPPGSCDSVDAEGECRIRPNFCLAIFDPVCGCDGVTYSNDCQRAAAGVPKDHDGECAVED